MRLFKTILSVLVSLVLVGSLFAPALAAAYKTGGAGTGQKAGQKGGWESFRWEKALRREAGRGVTAEGGGEAGATKDSGEAAVPKDSGEVDVPKDSGEAAAPAEGAADKGTAARAVQRGARRVRRGGGTTGIRGFAYSGGAALAGTSVENTAQTGSAKKASGGAGSGGASADGVDALRTAGGSAAKRTGDGQAAASGTGTPDSAPGTRAAAARGSAFRGVPVLPLSVRRVEASRSVCAPCSFEEGFPVAVPGAGTFPGEWFVSGNGTAEVMETGGAEPRAFADGIRTPVFLRSGQAAERDSSAGTRRGVFVLPDPRGAAHRLFYIRLYEDHPTGRGDAFRLGCRALAVVLDEDGRCRVRGGWNVCGKWIDFDGGAAPVGTGGVGGSDWRDGLTVPVAVPAAVPPRGSSRPAPALPNQDSAPTAGAPSPVPLADAAETGDRPQGWRIAALLSGLGAALLGRQKKRGTG